VVSEGWRVVWLESCFAPETREDFHTLFAAEYRAEELRDLGKAVMGPYRVDVDWAPGDLAD
jgi:hypothetical protein